jgi:hypothetical protein
MNRDNSPFSFQKRSLKKIKNVACSVKANKLKNKFSDGRFAGKN